MSDLDPHAQLARIEQKLEDLSKSFDEWKKQRLDIEKKLYEQFVTKAEFLPVRMVCFGLVGFSMLTLLGWVFGHVYLGK